MFTTQIFYHNHIWIDVPCIMGRRGEMLSFCSYHSLFIGKKFKWLTQGPICNTPCRVNVPCGHQGLCVRPSEPFPKFSLWEVERGGCLFPWSFPQRAHAFPHHSPSSFSSSPWHCLSTFWFVPPLQGNSWGQGLAHCLSCKYPSGFVLCIHRACTYCIFAERMNDSVVLVRICENVTPEQMVHGISIPPSLPSLP